MAISTIAEVSPLPQLLSGDDCRAALARSRFGHLAFTRNSHVEAMPVRFAFVDGWVYFRANGALRSAIASNPWVVVSIAETRDPTTIHTVVARGACYATERTGSASQDAAAMRGIMQLRDPQPVGESRTGKAERASIVFRMHVDHLRGYRTFCPRLADQSVGT